MWRVRHRPAPAHKRSMPWRATGSSRVGCDPGSFPSGPRRDFSTHRAIRGGRPSLVPGRWNRPRSADLRPAASTTTTTSPPTARPDEIKALLAGWADAVWTQGERFGTIGAKKDGRTYEITTHRAEAYNDDSRKPHVEFADDIETDLSRRDFTINAMALEVTAPTPNLVDPFGGAADLGDAHAAHAVVSRGVVQRRSVAHAARGAVHRPLSASAGSRVDGRRHRDARALADRVCRAHSRRARQAHHGAAPERGIVVCDRDGPCRRVSSRAAVDAPRTGSDPSAQGRVDPHVGGGRERATRHARRASTSGARDSRRCSTTSASHRRAAIKRARASRSIITTPSARG